MTSFPSDIGHSINDCLPPLRYQDNVLHFEGLNTKRLIEHHGTPLIIYSPDRVRSNVRSLYDAFERHFERVKVYYALKTCYVPEVVKAVREAGAGVEVMSDVELQIAYHNGFRPNDVLVNGVGRDARYVNRSLSSPVHLNFVDSLEDLGRIQARAQSLGVTASVGIRVNPTCTADGAFIRRGSKLGLDEEVFWQVLKAALQADHVEVKGILSHQFTHLDDLPSYRSVVARFTRLICEVQRRHQHCFEYIDLGGGLETRFLLERGGLTAEAFAKVAAEELAAVPYSYTLQLEPGRYVSADSAIGLTRVLADKTTSSTPWRITDIGSNVLIPVPEIDYYPLPTELPGDDDWSNYHVGDATCAPTKLCLDARLPTGPEGRELAILNCGAYTTVFSELWAGRLPTILSTDSEQVHVLFDDSRYRRMMKMAYGYSIE